MKSDSQHTLEEIAMDDLARAFLAGCLEARANPTAREADFHRAADAYVKLLIVEAGEQGARGV